jgi:hypothetical protein
MKLEWRVKGSTANSIAMATIAGINGKYVYDTL